MNLAQPVANERTLVQQASGQKTDRQVNSEQNHPKKKTKATEANRPTTLHLAINFKLISNSTVNTSKETSGPTVSG